MAWGQEKGADFHISALRACQYEIFDFVPCSLPLKTLILLTFSCFLIRRRGMGGRFFWSGRRGSNSLPGIPRMAVAIRRSPASPLDLTRFAQVEAASSPVLRHIPKRKHHPDGWCFLFGAGDEARTRYLDLGKVALYQMSYARKRRRCCGTLVPPVGVEPTTRGFSVRCSTN